MTRKSFIKTGILGTILGLFSPNLLAKSRPHNELDDYYLQKFELTTSSGLTGPETTEEQKSDFNKWLTKDGFPAHYKLDGTLDEILNKHRFHILWLFCRYRHDFGDKIDDRQEMKRLIEKYNVKIK